MKQQPGRLIPTTIGNGTIQILRNDRHHDIIIGSFSIHLTPTEYRLLLELLSEKFTTDTRLSQLLPNPKHNTLEQSGKRTFAPNAATHKQAKKKKSRLDKHIDNLRDKLYDTDIVILRIRSFGYLLISKEQLQEKKDEDRFHQCQYSA